MGDGDRECLSRDCCVGYSELDETGAAVDVTALVKDEVAYAIVNGLAVVLLHTLHGVGVVANKGIGTCID